MNLLDFEVKDQRSRSQRDQMHFFRWRYILTAVFKIKMWASRPQGAFFTPTYPMQIKLNIVNWTLQR